MSPARQSAYWIIALAALLLCLYLLSAILLPFVVGLAVAYFLDPVVDKLEERKIGRALATVMVLLVFFVAMIGAMLLLVPVLHDQIFGFAERLPSYIEKGREVLVPWIVGLAEKAGIDIGGDARTALSDLSKRALGVAAELLKQAWSSGLAFLNLISLIVISPIVAFYLLRDWDHLTAKVDGWLPREHEPQIRRLLIEIDAVLSGFVRGQGTVCLILGTFYAIALSVAGLEFGLIIGTFAGLVSFVPFVGVIVGLVLSMLTAVTQFWPDFTSIGIIAGIFLVGQVLEGNVLTPRLLGDKVGLHPVWVMFALLAGGALFGFVGVLLAIPVAAVIGVLARFLIGQYMGSRLFLGTDPPGTAADTESADE